MSRYTPTNHLRYHDIIGILGADKNVLAQDCMALSSEIIDYRNSFLGLLGAESLLFFANTRARVTYKQEVFIGDNVGLLFTASGSNLLRSGNEQARFKDCSVVLSFNTSAIESLREAGTSVRNLGIIIPVGELFEDYGLRFEALPRHIQLAALKKTIAPARLVLSLSPRCRFILEEICNSRLSYPLGYKYKAAKAVELICEVVETINRTLAIHPSARNAKALFQRDERILTAAQIYRRNIDSMPSVEVVANMVGLNRNTITDGFKEMFSMSPGEYSRVVRLDWAREKICAGDVSVAEVAKMCGYTTTSAFSRAYKDHFGKCPSQE